MESIIQFKADVLHEATMLKHHATEEERLKLNATILTPTNKRLCVYGLLSGSCDSVRAKELMDLCCIRVMSLSSLMYEMTEAALAEMVSEVNGAYTGQTWATQYSHGLYSRYYKYMSVLEAYICSPEANTVGLIDYIKGVTETVEL